VLAGVPVGLAVDDPVRRIKPRPSCPEAGGLRAQAVCGGDPSVVPRHPRQSPSLAPSARSLTHNEVRSLACSEPPRISTRLPANRIDVVARLSAATVWIGRE
jgi:hypothetical protein